MQIKSTARWGLLVKIISFSLILVCILSFFMLAQMTTDLPLVVVGTIKYLPFLLLIFFWMRRILYYEIVDQKLKIRRLIGVKEYSLVGIQSIQKPYFQWTKIKKHFGNSGIFQFSGKFSYPKIGKFRAYVTDWEKAILIEWKDKKVVISPSDEEAFLEALANTKEKLNSRIDLF